MTTASKANRVSSMWSLLRRPTKDEAAFLLVRREDRGATAIFHLAGRLTREETDILRLQVEEALADGTARLVLNLAACPFADSAGMATLLSLQEQARQAGRGLVLAEAGPQIRSLLEMMRLQSLFELRSSLDEALAS